MLFNKQKNRFLEIIQTAGLDAHIFETKALKESFTVKLRDSRFQFKVEYYSASEFRYSRTCFVPKFPLLPEYKSNGKAGFTIEELYKRFDDWIEGHVKEYLSDVAAPDLWEQVKRETYVIDEAMFDKQDVSGFSDEEKAQLKLSLNEFRLSLKETFNPTKDQMEIVDERLKYLSAALDRLNRFDWKSVLISSAVSIAAALSLDTARGKILFDLLKQALSHVNFLLQ